MSSGDDIHGDYQLFHYTPSVAAAAVVAVIFIGLTSYHSWSLFRTRTWFCIPFVVGGLFETIGYAARIASHYNRQALVPYIIQSLLILLAPILFAASIYMILGRVIRATNGAKYSLIRITWLTKIFVGGDIFCFLVQGAGGGMLAKAKTAGDVSLGQNVILGGLILQIVVFCFFVAVALLFHRRMSASPTLEAQDAVLPWQRFMVLLYAVSVFITVRNLFRVIEYAMGQDGYLLRHEWSLYIFDALLMVLVLVLCTQWYVSSIRPKNTAMQMESRNSHEELAFAAKSGA